jgi:hypothetical protein
MKLPAGITMITLDDPEKVVEVHNAIAEAVGEKPLARRVSMGNAQGTHADRGHDVYETPPGAVYGLLEAEGGLPLRLWEPCCGPNQNIARVLRAHKFRVAASDLLSGIDFFKVKTPPAGVEAIVTNPPYKLAAEFVRHGLELVPMVVMLLRLNFLESEARSDIIDGGQLARVHVFANRLPRMHRESWTGARSSSTTAYAWFVWERRHRGPIELRRTRCFVPT